MRHPPFGPVIGIKGPDIASASVIAPGLAADSWDITGTTTINHCTVAGWPVGRRILLQFDASVQLTLNAGSVPAGAVPFILHGAANLAATAGDVIELWYDGASLRQTAPAAVI